MRRIAVLAFAFAIACGSSEPRDEFVGSYNLSTVNGQPLPFVTSVSNATASLNSALLIISPAGEFSISKSGTQQIGTQAPTTATEVIIGTWRTEGGTIRLSAVQPPTLLSATYASGSLTYTDGGRTYVYRR